MSKVYRRGRYIKRRDTIMRRITKRIAAVGTILALSFGTAETALAKTVYGNNANGASTEEVAQVVYVGWCWNHPGSGYRYAEHWYYRPNKGKIGYRQATNGARSSRVWDSLSWGPDGRTYFHWNRG